MIHFYIPLKHLTNAVLATQQEVRNHSKGELMSVWVMSV